MGHTTELIAQLLNISREEMDEVALRSHNNVERATKNGDFKDEIVPVEIPQKKGKPPIIFDKDEHFRPGLTMEQLKALPSAFIPKVGKVTAGNSSGLNDGASAMIIMSARKSKGIRIETDRQDTLLSSRRLSSFCDGLEPGSCRKKSAQRRPSA